MRSRAAGVGGLALAALLVGSIPPPGVRAEESKTVCDGLANVFYVISEYKKRGDSKETQQEWVRDMFRKKHFSAQLLERAVDYVYRSGEDSEQIRAQILDGCVVNSRGQAVVRLPGL
jgi:hypothetical protein